MSCPVSTAAAAPAVPAEADDRSLWLRMGGEAVIKPMVSAIYDLHASDPLSAELFGPMKFANSGDASVVKEHVFTFFSAGIGGPHEYKGRSMIDAHKGMKVRRLLVRRPIYTRARRSFASSIVSIMLSARARLTLSYVSVGVFPSPFFLPRLCLPSFRDFPLSQISESSFQAVVYHVIKVRRSVFVSFMRHPSDSTAHHAACSSSLSRARFLAEHAHLRSRRREGARRGHRHSLQSQGRRAGELNKSVFPYAVSSGTQRYDYASSTDGVGKRAKQQKQS